jgi:ketosteroid isomerase-like protein
VSQNLDLVRSIYADWERGDYSSAAAGLFHIRDGKVTKYVQYLERDRALADLGLAE